MKIKTLIIENFRAYHERTEIDFDDLTVFVGKNDVGKSSILEALDIFFENSKPDKDDRNIHTTGNVKIGVVFKDIPDTFLIDSKVKTSLKDEQLLSSNGFLEIYKEFKTKTEVSLSVHCHPDVQKFDLINSTIEELKFTAGKLGLDISNIDKRISSEIRQQIRQTISTDPQTFKSFRLKLDTENEAKDVWKKIQSQLPFYALFKADRSTSDKDKEIQDPMKLATKQILKDLEGELDAIKERVKTYVSDLASRTIGKLREMDTEIASSLETIFEDAKWEKAFDIRLESDQIPLDKKGSGLRRLVLINFFRAEADRKMSDKKLPHIIYAIEEPETSQHPDWQVKLVEALKELSQLDNTQVLLTTHSPALASLIEADGLRFVRKTGNIVTVEKGNQTNLDEIAKTLGVLPKLPDNIDGLKLIICVEGYTDIHFFTNVLSLFGIDVENDPRIVMIFTGGATLEHWVKNNYLKKLGKPELHICDNDVTKYQDYLNEVNIRNDGSIGLMTLKRETENYIHPTVISELFALDEPVFNTTTVDWHATWDTTDVPLHVSTTLKALNKIGSSVSKVKKSLCTDGSKRMTRVMFEEINAISEIESWKNEIISRIS